MLIAYAHLHLPGGQVFSRQVVEFDDEGHPLRFFPLTEETPFTEWRDEEYTFNE